MNERQHTLAQPATIEGVGLHTGQICKMTLQPADENTGIVFVRTDIDGHVEIPALIDYVKDDTSTSSLRGTNLEIDGVKIHTVEHVMAALAGMRVDNCRIEINAPEPPIMDGSAIEFVKLIKNAGVVEQEADRNFVVIEETLDFKNDKQGTQIVVLPSQQFRITVMVDYHNPALGSQHTGLFNLVEEFETEFAPARTFCFLNEIEYLYSQGLIKGGSLESAIVICDADLPQEKLDQIREMLHIDEDVYVGENGIINDIPLRFPNEPSRHKALDLLGDLYLVGAPVKGHILAARPGHQSNIEITRQIRDIYKNQLIKQKYAGKQLSKDVVFDVNAIKKILPHRYPFLLVDKVVEYEVGKRIIAIKNVTANEPQFQGHFPGMPVFPGVLICEALAQTGGILFLNMIEEPEKKWVLFMSMNNVKFRKPVVPGDTIEMEVILTKQRRQTCQIQGYARVNGEVVTEGEFMAVVTDREDVVI